ncbi:LemA family protein [bacterium]|nr:LemA family protein [bacterium]
MSSAVIGFLVILGIFSLFILVLIGIYNGLIQLRNLVKNAWAQIDVQLKRRYDLIPNLIETVKGYAKHERETLEAVVQARQQAINITDSVIDKAKAENFLSQTLRSIFALTESYPDLKANQNFLELQEELVSTENKIGFARQYYNDSVMKLNNKIETFPSNIIAGMFNFKLAEFFEVKDQAQKEVPQVKF